MRPSNPGFDYESLQVSYSGYRSTDPLIAAQVLQALGDAQTVLNVGAGAGSYEPTDRYVVALEPSAAMRSQRISLDRSPAVIGSSEAIPFDDGSFDASMAMVTIHHWKDIAAGLHEMRRVTRGPIVLLTFDPERMPEFWINDYFPELIAAEKGRFPTMAQLREMLGGDVQINPVRIPLSCRDGFTEGYYGRPEAFLEEGVRRAQSCWSFLPAGLEEVLVTRFAETLASGAWDEKYGHLRTQKEATYSLCLVRAVSQTFKSAGGSP
jgi:SAM-dependent methyltransferase